MGEPVTITPDQAPTQGGPVTITPDAPDQSGLHLSNPSTVPNARIRNMPNPVDPSWSPGRALYEGAKTGLELGSIPATAGQPIASVARGALGAAAGGFGAKTLAKAAGAGDFGQEVAGDVGGLVGGGLTEGAANTRVGKTTGKVIGGIAQDIPGVRQAGKISQYWNETAPKPTYPGAPLPETPPAAAALSRGPSSPPDPAAGLRTIKSGQLAEAFKDPGAPNPETPDPQLLKARSLFEGSSSPRDPAAGLGTIKQTAPGQAGQLAESMQKKSAEVAPGFNRGSLGKLLDQSLGAEQPNVQPGKPIYQRSPAGPPSGAKAAQLPEGHTALEGSSALRSYKYDPSAKEFEAWPTSGDTAYRYGDVSPDAAQAFEQADSKGKAFQQIKNSGTLVAKRINGKWTPVKAGQ